MSAPTHPRSRPRLRDLGIVLGELSPGPLNAITDVPGVRVGQTTLISGSGPLVPGQGPIRTGVTAILPHEGNPLLEKVPAAVHVINGAGEVTGRSLVEEWGLLETPICLTNTLNVGLVYDAVIEWMARTTGALSVDEWSIPMVAECYDGYLNDIQGRHVHTEHVLAALESADGGPVAEGSVGGGTGMTCYQFKGGNGTSSRVVETAGGRWTVGALVQANHGARHDLRIGGLPAGTLLADAPLPGRRQDGSIIIVLATDAPLDAHQLRRLASRGALGLARTGSTARNGSGDFTIAFSNHPANRVAPLARGAPRTLITLQNEDMTRLFNAAVESVEEAILNALCAADDMVGRDDHFVAGLPVERVRALWQAHHLA
ncbi:MAG TPA: P1 family peptidase [Ktedonobacterales bacterium]